MGSGADGVGVVVRELNTDPGRATLGNQSVPMLESVMPVLMVRFKGAFPLSNLLQGHISAAATQKTNISAVSP